MTKTRRSFTDEFKQEAVALLESSGRPLGQIATELGIQPSMLRNWRRREATSGGPPQRPIKPAAAAQAVGDRSAEIARLKRENERLRTERDIPKKTVCIFSEPPK